MMEAWPGGVSSTATRSFRSSSTRTSDRRPCASRASWSSTGAGGPAGSGRGDARQSGRAPRSSRATRCPTGRGRSRKLTPAISSATSPPLGDGRAILLGEQITPSGDRRDIQLKGPGPTPYSRRGDGRAALGPMLREYIISEAMHALGIPTTRSLAVVDDRRARVSRDGARRRRAHARGREPHPRRHDAVGGGTSDEEALRALADYTRARHYPELAGRAGAAPGAARRDRRCGRRRLIARWQLVGFIHGVMNTDNMALSGETIDYGPCAFMDAYDRPRSSARSITPAATPTAISRRSRSGT